MPMNVQSNAAQEFIWEMAQEFQAVNLAGTWTMRVIVKPTENKDTAELRSESPDYNAALIDLQDKINAYLVR